MQIENLEVGVKKTLVAYYKERGVSAQDAETKADANLEASCAFIRSKLKDARGKEDFLAAGAEAFVELKAASQNH